MPGFLKSEMGSVHPQSGDIQAFYHFSDYSSLESRYPLERS